MLGLSRSQVHARNPRELGPHRNLHILLMAVRPHDVDRRLALHLDGPVMSLHAPSTAAL